MKTYIHVLYFIVDHESNRIQTILTQGKVVIHKITFRNNLKVKWHQIP